MLKKIFNYIKKFILEEYKFIMAMISIFIILNIPLNYYIIVGGGISGASSRINVENKYKSKGSFNISYVTQLNGNVLTYVLSYIIPSWERENSDNYKYDVNEDIKDIKFRSELDLKTANGDATYWAYTLANKKIKETSRHLYIIATYKEDYETPLEVQDEIISIDDKTYDSVNKYSEYLQTKKTKDIVKVKVIRNKKEKILNSKIYDNKGFKLLGVTLQYVKEYETTPKLDIKFKHSESGPSGGLITTLEIYNQLTKSDLTKGKTIAGTGTIEPDGTIGQIGGIEHKLLGAHHAKADIFLCPAGKNYTDAKKYIKKKNIKIKLIKVTNIKDTINELKRCKKEG